MTGLTDAERIAAEAWQQSHFLPPLVDEGPPAEVRRPREDWQQFEGDIVPLLAFCAVGLVLMLIGLCTVAAWLVAAARAIGGG